MGKKAVMKKRGMALSQILILVLATISIAYFLGSEIGVVSAETFPSQGDLIGPGTCTGQERISCSGTVSCNNGNQVCSAATASCTSSPIICPSGQTATCSNEKQVCSGGPPSCDSSTKIVCPSGQTPQCGSDNKQTCTGETVDCTGPIPTCPQGQTATCTNPNTGYTCTGETASCVGPSCAGTGNPLSAASSSLAPMAGYYLFGKFVPKGAAAATGTAGATAGTTAGAEGAKIAAKGLFQKPFFVAAQSIIINAAAAAGIYYGIKFIGPFFKLDKSAIDSAAKAGAIGYMAGYGALKLGASKAIASALGVSTGVATFGIGLIVAATIFILTYKKSQEQNIAFQCLPWQAVLGGKNCEQCNKGPFPCTEYQCKSLGQACELVNQDTNEKLCIWKNRKDTKPPVIQPWEDALSDSKLSYKPDGKQSPPDRGVFVTYNGKCLPAFTPFSFGIKLDEPATCKADITRKKTYDEMSMYFGDTSLTRYNFTQTVSLPSNESLAVENITLQNDGNYEIYVRCIDVNGNPVPSSPSSTFVFKYCVDKGPDAQAPIIVGTNPITLPDGIPIGFNQSSMGIEVYVNEPSECKYSRERDLDFSQMEGNMSCSSSVFEMNAQMLYKCTTTLTSIKNQVKNDFYFRCKDKPKALKDRNVMSKGYKFTVKGTQPLVIDSILPNGTVRDSTSPAKITLKVETSAGYKEGDSTCYYSESCYLSSGKKDKYTMFYYSQGLSSYTHAQDLWVAQGNYQCSVRCVDLGGNTDEKKVGYRVEIDAASPLVVRAYHEDPYLKIITNEKSSCVYDTQSCSYLFDDGIALNSGDKLLHFTEWDATQTYYIKCEDEYNNQPFPNQCSIIVKPFEMYERE